MIVKNLPQKNIEDYRRFSQEEYEKILELSKDLKGLRILHVNATSFGGGVAELLYTLVPLMKSLGLDAVWEVIEAPDDFFNVTKKIHNLLQGADLKLNEDEWNLYLKINKENSKKLSLDADVVIIHDPQPAGVFMFANSNAKKIWRCHIDLSSPNGDFWKMFKELLNPYQKLLFHLKEYIPVEFKNRSLPFPPSIDPLSEKNMELPEREIKGVAEKYGIDRKKPLLTVVARFDPWKDLFSAIDVYRLVKKVHDVQLAIVSAMASDDPEGWIFYEKVLRYAGIDEDIKFLTNLIGVGAQQVNALQRLSTIGLHTATKEGFGLVISEIMWKEKPVVARPAGGVKIQVDDGLNGYLNWDKERLAENIVDLLNDKRKLLEYGRNAKEKVRKNFLSINHIRRYLEVIRSII